MGKKRHRSKLVSEIPDVLTANIGSTTRKEIESTPEVFEQVHSPSVSASEISNNPESTMTSTERTSKKAKRKKVTRKKRRVQITKRDKVQSYDVENLRIFSGSSGTHSYDSSRSAKSLSRHLGKCKYIVSSPLDSLKADYMITNPKVAVCPALFKSYSQPAFSAIVKSKEPPAFGDYESRYGIDHQKQLIKEATLNALTEFFDTARDDICLTIQVRRERERPVMELNLAKTPKKEIKGSNKRHNEQSVHLDGICRHRIGDNQVAVMEQPAPSLLGLLAALCGRAYAAIKSFWSD